MLSSRNIFIYHAYIYYTFVLLCSYIAAVTLRCGQWCVMPIRRSFDMSYNTCNILWTPLLIHTHTQTQHTPVSVSPHDNRAKFISKRMNSIFVIFFLNFCFIIQLELSYLPVKNQALKLKTVFGKNR